MKRFLLLALAGSLAGNAYLLRDLRRASSIPATPVPVAPAAALRTESPPDPTAHVDRRTWERLTAHAEPADLVARLRAAEFPPHVIRLMLTLHLYDRHADRRRAIRQAYLAAPYWGTPIDPAFNRANRALSREIGETVEKLLGPGATESPPADPDAWTRRHGALSPEKVAAIQRITSDYSDLRTDITTAAGRILLPEDREKLALLEKEQRADTERLLTPEELVDYDLRNGRTAQTLRFQLAAFNPSEQEFRAIHQVVRALDTQFPQSRTLTPEERRQKADAEAQLGPQLEIALGPERYADYKRATDPAWLQAHRYVTANELPASVTGRLAGLQQELSQRAAALRDERTLGAEQRNAQLAALAEEAERRLAATLGADRLDDYRTSQGAWLRSLQPAPAGR